MKRHNQVIKKIENCVVNTKTASRYCHIAAYYPGFVNRKQQYIYMYFVLLAEANRRLVLGSAAAQIF